MLDNKGTDTRSEYVILIALPRQQCLRERASMLRLCYSKERRTERRVAVALNITGCLRFETFQNTNLMHNSFILQHYICYTTLLNMFRAVRSPPAYCTAAYRG